MAATQKRSEPIQPPTPAPGGRQKLLFVCARNRIRSLTAEKMLAGSPHYSVRSRGVADNARIKITARDISWSDQIFVMEKDHQNRLREKFRDQLVGRSVVCLFIEDLYQPMGADLIAELRQKLAPYLNLSGPPPSPQPVQAGST